MAIVRTISGYLLAVATTIVLASAFHTHMVVAGLNASGASVPFGAELGMMPNDLVGLAPQYGIVIALALLLGFLIAALLRRILKPLAPIAFPLAGAAAVGTALFIMGQAFDGITPIAGARTTAGFALQCLAGGIGGLLFGLFAGRARA